MTNGSSTFRAIRFFRWFCNPEFVDDIEGDLLERYAIRSAKHGQLSARMKLNKDVIQLFRPGIIRPVKVKDSIF